jgi:uncharacterized protein (TIGR02444 family)
MQDQRMEQAAAGEALWRFSLALYARPRVAEALIALQDRAGSDVNLMLFALWVGAIRARRLDPAELARAKATIGPLNAAAVYPLRRLRRELKTAAGRDVQALRRRILHAELGAERQVQHCLAAAVSGGHSQPGTPPLTAAKANLALYLGDEAGSADADVLLAAVAGLMRAYYSGIRAGRIGLS